MALTNAQFEKIMRLYNDRQLDNQRALDRRIDQAYTLVPRLKEISDEIVSLSIQKASYLLRQETSNNIKAQQSTKEHLPADFNLTHEIEKLAAERTALLLAHGMTADYLLPHYHCPYCKDTGFVEGKKCRCFRTAELAFLYTGSGESEVLSEETFERFSLDYYSEQMTDPRTGMTSKATAVNALHKAKEFVAEFGTAYRNLCFYGNTGVGKSFLSHCIAGELVQKGHQVLYLTAHDFFESLAKSTFEREDSELETSIFNADLLIIDDLGTELTNSFSSSRLFLCINERDLKKKATIISTNLSLEHMSELYSERTFSRIMSSYELIYLFGKDIRIQKQLSGGK